MTVVDMGFERALHDSPHERRENDHLILTAWGHWPPQSYRESREGEVAMRPTRDELILWIVLGLAFLLGMALIIPPHIWRWEWDLGILHDIGIAFVVASILGFTIDRFLQQRFAKDVFQAAVGYILPPELRQEVHWITSFEFLATSLHRVTIVDLADGTVKISTDVERELENITSTPKKIRPRVDVDDWGKGSLSEILICEITTSEGITLQSPRTEDKGHYLHAETEEVLVHPEERIRVFCRFVEYKTTNDLVTFGLSYPSKNPEIDVTVSPSLEFEADFGHHGEKITMHSGSRRMLRGTFLPHHILSVRWWPKQGHSELRGNQ
jgi:hypothetical protein